MSKEEFITEEKVINTPAGGVLIGKDKEGQTIIPNDGSLGGFLIGRLHKDGGIKAVNKSTGQPLEMQGNEIIITAPAVADQAKHTFDGKTMTNREILSKINSDGGGVSFANGGDIPAKIHTTDKEHDFDGKKVNDSEIANYLGMKSTLKNGSQLFSSGNITFDVDAIYKAIDSGNILYEVKEFDTFPMKYSVYDKKYSETVKPDFNKANGIMVRLENGEEVLIDGNHRMNNAYINGLEKIKTYYISDLKEIEDFTKKNKFKIGGENKVGGHLSKGKNLEQIANMHNVSLAHINEQLEKGLEVEKEHFADFKERTRVAKDHLVENPNYYTILEKAGLESGGGLYDSKPFLDYYFEQIAEFLKDQNNIDLKEDFTFFYKGENFIVEPMLLIDKNKEAPLKTANFTILDNEGEVVGEIDFKENNGNSEDKKKQFTAYSEFFNWDNFKFENGGHFDDGGSVNYEDESYFNNKSKFLKAFYKTNNPSVDKLLIECQPLINELIEKQKEIHLKETFNMFGVAKPMTKLDLEYYEIGLLYKMVQSFNKYLKVTDVLSNATIKKHLGLFEISATVNRDGKDYKYYTELISAGGYNIQEYHYRYITKTDLPESRENSAVENIKSKLSTVKKIQTIDEEIVNYGNRIKKSEEAIKNGFRIYFIGSEENKRVLDEQDIVREKNYVKDYYKELDKLKAKKQDLESVFNALEKKGVGVNFGKEIKEAIGRKLIDRLHASKYKETGDTLEFKIENRSVRGDKIDERTYSTLGQINTFVFTDEGNGLCTIKAGLELRGKYTLYAEFKNVLLKDIPLKINEIFRGEFQRYLKDGGDLKGSEIYDEIVVYDKPFVYHYNDEDIKADKIILMTKKRAYFDKDFSITPIIKFESNGRIFTGYTANLQNAKNKISDIIKDIESDNFTYSRYGIEPNYKSGGILKPHHKHEEELVKDAKYGNTPARDLNNYNDLLDVQADGSVGGDSGINMDGAYTPTDAGAVSGFADGGNVDSVKNDFEKSILEGEEKFEKTYSEIKSKEEIIAKIIKDKYDQKFEARYVSMYSNDGWHGEAKKLWNLSLDELKEYENTLKNTNVMEEKNIKQENMTSKVSNWDVIPSVWKDTSKVKKVTWINSPFDKGLNSILEPFLGKDSNRPNMTGINFDDNGITATDAYTLITLPYPNSKFNGIYKSDLSKKKDESQTTIDGVYPNYQVVIPKIKDIISSNQISVYKLLQYTKVALKYANKYTNQINYKVGEDDISFNGELLIIILNTLLKLGHEKVYFSFKGNKNGTVFSPKKEYELGSDEILLLMPVLKSSENSFGAYDMDYDREFTVYYDFADDSIHNSNGEVADFKMEYKNNIVVPISDVKLLKKLATGKNKFYISNLVSVQNKTAFAYSSDLETDISIKNVELPDGLYNIVDDVLEGTMTPVEDFPKIATLVKDEKTIEFVISSATFEYYVDKLKFALGNDDLRPLLMGICLHYTLENRLYLVATDANILLKVELTDYVDIPKYDFEAKQVINPKYLFDFLNNLEECALHITSNNVATTIKAQKYEFYSRNIDGNYPNYNGIIKYYQEAKVTLGLNEVSKCLKGEKAKSYVKDLNKDNQVLIFNKSNSLMIGNKEYGYRKSFDEAKLDKVEKLCEVEMKVEEVKYSYDDGSILVAMSSGIDGDNFSFVKKSFDKIIDIVSDGELVMYYTQLNGAYMIPIHSVAYERTKKEHKTKEQKPNQKQIKKVLEQEKRQLEDKEVEEAIEILTILSETSEGKEKEEIEEALEVLEMLSETSKFEEGGSVLELDGESIVSDYNENNFGGTTVETPLDVLN